APISASRLAHSARSRPSPRARRCASSALRRPAPRTTGTPRPPRRSKRSRTPPTGTPSRSPPTAPRRTASSAPSSTSSTSRRSRNPSSALTAVMTDQVDIGWASPPFGLKEMEEGKIRVVAKATDATLVRGQTIRTIVANADVLAKRKDAIGRFMKAYRESIDYMYGDNPQVIKDYAEIVGVPEPLAKRVRDDFFSKPLVSPDEIKGLDSLLQEAVTLKFIPAPLTKEQLAELIQIQR